LGILALAHRLAKLKRVSRTGWLDRGVAAGDVESVADHSFGTALLAWACALERQREGAALDPQRVLLLALIHDLPEADTGDAPPYDPASLPDDPGDLRAFLDRRHIRDDARDTAKRAQEDAVMQELLHVLPDTTGSALGEIWRELRQGTSEEARFVKQIDRLETFLQSRQYLRSHPDLPVDSFRREVLETIEDPLLQSIRDAALTTVDPATNPPLPAHWAGCPLGGGAGG
jgi:putative hydrolase of HD superfamily